MKDLKREKMKRGESYWRDVERKEGYGREVMWSKRKVMGGREDVSVSVVGKLC